MNNAELEAKHQKYKGRVVIRDDIVKDDSGSYAVFTEQGSSASQMTAAKIMDIISRLPGCDGQAADAVSAFSQVKMEDAHKLLQIQKSECPDIWIRLAGARPSAARHCGGAKSTAAPPSVPLLPRARAGAQYDVVPPCYGTLGLSDTAHVESGELSYGAHAAQTARLA